MPQPGLFHVRGSMPRTWTNSVAAEGGTELRVFRSYSSFVVDCPSASWIAILERHRRARGELGRKTVGPEDAADRGERSLALAWVFFRRAEPGA